ncbi:hypothetical protein V1498_11805 [Peribacillus sp. SCS-26]|uniref:hypothetical protein n=1 Tax=Paraperibacillus marinus TaxID=3115295 RepID=UPI0039069BA4
MFFLEKCKKRVKVNLELEGLELKYTKRVVIQIQSLYGIDKAIALEMLVEKTAYLDLMETDADLVMHYPPKYWIDKLLQPRPVLA